MRAWAPDLRNGTKSMAMKTKLFCNVGRAPAVFAATVALLLAPWGLSAALAQPAPAAPMPPQVAPMPAQPIPAAPAPAPAPVAQPPVVAQVAARPIPAATVPAPAPVAAPVVLAPRPIPAVAAPVPAAVPAAQKPAPFGAALFDSPAASEASTAPAKPASTSGSIVLNFEGADIREVIFSLASALEINYWIDPRVQGQITVRTTGSIARADLFPVFHQLLRNNGFAAIKKGQLYEIVPAEEGKTRTPIDGGGQLLREGHFVMELVSVRHVGAEQMATTLAPFVSPGGDVIGYPRSNLIVITDIAANAARLVDLVSTFDTDSFSDMHARVYPVEHAILEDVIAEMQSLMEAYQVVESGAGVFLIPLVRLNAIAVVAFDPTVHIQVEHWLGILDVESESGARREVYVYRVENSKAVDLSTVLNEIYSDDGGSGSTRRSRSGEADEAGLGLGGGLSSRRNNRNNQNQRGGANANREQRTAGGARGLVLGGGADGDGADQLFEQEVRIVEDEITNSLVILATPRDYSTIRKVLLELDIVPRQVLIEVMIAEVSLSDSDIWNFNQSLIPAESSSANSDSADATNEDAGGSFFDAFGEEVRLIGDIGSSGLMGTVSHFRDGIEVYRAVLTSAKTRGRLKVLSRPHIMTSDNQEARILVGQEVPIITSQADTNVQTNNNTRFLQNVQYRDTGVIISVLPQVNSEGLVNLQLSQEVSEIDDSTSQTDISSPTFRTREAETSVVVTSGETIIIGGIISETNNEAQTGVPFLMDLPVFGRFFRGSLSRSAHTELIILITPYVVRDREEAISVTEEFKRRVDGVLRELEGSQTIEEGLNHTLILTGTE
jgi:general secretion pathway protein D